MLGNLYTRSSLCSERQFNQTDPGRWQIFAKSCDLTLRGRVYYCSRMLFDVTETDPRRDWSYLTEGGASVVFAYVGQQHPVCSGKALRVYKTWRQHLAGPDLPGSPNVHGEHNEDFLVAFQKSIISQLLPEKYLPDMQSVHVTNEWLFELAVRAEPFRPAVRKQGVIDNSRKVAVLVTNLVDKGLAVEIKVN